MSHALPLDFTTRPGLAYQDAFDWLAMLLHQARPSACYATQPLHQRELAQRGLDACHLTVWPHIPEIPISNWGCVEPIPADLPHLAHLLQALPPNGRLHLVVAGTLNRFLVEQRQQEGKHHFASEKAVTAVLRQGDWKITQRFGLHGLRAVAWHQAGNLAGQLGWLHWQDRCHYGMRRSYASRHNGLAALVCLSAERAP